MRQVVLAGLIVAGAASGVGANSILSFTGQTTYVGPVVDLGGVQKQLNVTLDYRVFAPGQFTGSFTPFSTMYGDFRRWTPTILSTSTNSTAPPPPYGVQNLPLGGLNIDLGLGAVVHSLGYGSITRSEPLAASTAVSSGGSAASWASLGADSALFKFVHSRALAAGDSDGVLLLTSPQGPGFVSSNVIDAVRWPLAGAASPPRPSSRWFPCPWRSGEDWGFWAVWALSVPCAATSSARRPRPRLQTIPSTRGQ